MNVFGVLINCPLQTENFLRRIFFRRAQGGQVFLVERLTIFSFFARANILLETLGIIVVCSF